MLLGLQPLLLFAIACRSPPPPEFGDGSAGFRHRGQRPDNGPGVGVVRKPEREPPIPFVVFVLGPLNCFEPLLLMLDQPVKFAGVLATARSSFVK
jgi:hypothetical protein